MGRRCCITGCTSTSRLPEHHGVTYHSFPVDENTRSIWIRNTKLSTDRHITKSVLVCSRHFRRADFQPQRSGKYLLKQKVFPTVFPWGKIDATQIEEDLEFLNTSGIAASTNAVLTSSSVVDDDTKATVAATVAQIMAQTAELNAAAGIKLENPDGDEAALAEGLSTTNPTSPPGVKFEPVTSFNPGARLEAQDFDGVWHSARIVEVDNDDREVLIKFEKSGKNKSTMAGTEEWIPMNSSRLRQRISTKPILNFNLEEKCLARWTGPRKFPGTVKKVLPNDTYEILFDDGYIKNVRAIHMSKVQSAVVEPPAIEDIPEDIPVEAPTKVPTPLSTPVAVTTSTPTTVKRPSSGQNSGSQPKKRAPNGPRKDWPLLDLSKLDLSSLNLPEIPKDGEWTCHWVNDQPIGREGYLVVGEHRKPTVVVDDWRLPTGWVKHMYQRSNVLGKWDVILVTPNGKRFRSKADLKTYLEEQGQVYNPDIYDFSIHRRRAKDINCYAHTPDYIPQQPFKSKTAVNTSLDSSFESKSEALGSLSTSVPSPYMETPIAEPLPPIELLTTSATSLSAEDKSVTQVEADLPKQLLESAEVSSTPTPTSTPTVGLKEEIVGTTECATPPITSVDSTKEDGFALIGGLKVQIIDNLFRCPQEGCSKNFRKENHLQIHVKHYHPNLIKLLGACPKMQELAEKRTHSVEHDANEPVPKNQISNQQFFAKLHQQDLEHTRAHRRSVGGVKPTTEAGLELKPELTEEVKIKEEDHPNVESSLNDTSFMNITTASSSAVDNSFTTNTTADNSALTESALDDVPLIKRSRFSPSKRPAGSRKSNRQRTTRKYLTAAQATAGVVATVNASTPLPVTGLADTSFSCVAEFEDTRHSFNATPDINKDAKKRKLAIASHTPLSSVDSPITADSGSNSFQPTNSIEAETINQTPQYIKENGELIKIVHMRQEEIINCLCGYCEEDGLMIQCELCLCWQHGICNGIDKVLQVPDKYVCYICRNPQRSRESVRFKHDQDWLFEGKLPVANFHGSNSAQLTKRSEYLKRSHTLTGNLLELKNYMHSLKVKINIANNKCHPKLYLWAKKWDEDIEGVKNEIKTELEMNSKTNTTNLMLTPSAKKIKSEPNTPAQLVPNIPQPEAPIDPLECQQRLLEHIKIQQKLVMGRLSDIEAAIDVLEREDEMPDLREADFGATKDVLAAFIKELDTVKQIAKLNTLEHTKSAYKNPIHPIK